MSAQKVGHATVTFRDRSVRKEGGFSIIELLVVMLIMGVVLTALTGGIIAINRTAADVDVRTDNINQGRQAIAVLSRDLRAASEGPSAEPPFAIAEPRRARFYARLGTTNVPVRIDLRVTEDGRLIETLTEPLVNTSTGAVTYPSSNERERYVASFIFNTDDQPVLSYFNVDDTGARVSLGETVTGNELGRIGLVRLDIRIARDRAARNVAQPVATEVRLPNQGGN